MLFCFYFPTFVNYLRVTAVVLAKKKGPSKYLLFHQYIGLLFGRNGLVMRTFSRFHLHGWKDLQLGFGYADSTRRNDGIDADQLAPSPTRRHLYVVFQEPRRHYQPPVTYARTRLYEPHCLLVGRSVVRAGGCSIRGKFVGWCDNFFPRDIWHFQSA